MRYIYLSPHLDDASLSAGGWIYDQAQAGNQVEIWTFMCGYPQTKDLSSFAEKIHKEWGMESAEDVVRERRQEDVNSANILGATTQHFNFLDCIYRRGSTGNWLYPSTIFVDPHPEDENLPQQIADEILLRLKPDCQLVCQFSIGKHVDHVLVRRAAELLNKPLLYVADIPYLFNFPQHLAPNTAGMKETVSMVSETGIHVWAEAVLAYKSQISMLFDNTEQVKHQIQEYCQTNGGIHFWLK
jgi:LmbE family N-acetylglucosaminyl deacetylase